MLRIFNYAKAAMTQIAGQIYPPHGSTHEPTKFSDGKPLHHAGAAVGLALSVLSVMHKSVKSQVTRSRKSLAIRQDLFILSHQQPGAVKDSGRAPRNSDEYAK